jgi:hypothetical protein
MARFVSNTAAINRYMTDPAQPVMRALAVKGDKVLNEARRILAHSEWRGDLDASLRVTVAHGRVGIGSSLPHVVYLHDGTGPAHITGNGGFGSVPSPNAPYFPPWNNSPNFVAWADDHLQYPYEVAKQIFLHGTKPVPFLREALAACRF